MRIERLPLNCKPLDHLLGGGIEHGSITNFYGPAGSGKTNICIQASISCIKNGKRAVFIDTEGGLSMERFAQIAENPKEMLKRMIVMEPKSFEEQERCVEKLEDIVKKGDVGLIVLDSLVTLYRLELDGNGEVNRRLAKQLSILSRISRERNIPILITNQVYSDMDGGVELVSRDVAKYWAKCLVELQKMERGRRLAILRKHRSLPEGSETQFQIGEKGLEEAKGFKLF